MICKNPKCTAELPDDAVFCLKCGRRQVPAEPVKKKRGNGQGTAIKRGDTWTAVWTEASYIGDDNKLHWRRRWKSGFSSKSAALVYASSPAQEAPAAPTLRNYWRGWSTSDMLDLSDNRRSAYKTAWAKMESIADKRMDELTIIDLQDCIDAKTESYYPAKDMKTILSHCFKRAVAEGNARTNLAEFIRLPQLAESELMPFNEAELHKLWTAYGDGVEFAAYILLMIYTGMMPGELLKLRREMIDFDTCEINGCGLKTKKRKSTPIVFPDMIAPMLRQLADKNKDGKVLKINKDRFYVVYHETIQQIGIRDLPPYSCRHTTGTALALGNIAPSVIQEVMRHAKFTTTQRYIHPDSASTRAAVNTMDKGKKDEAEK